MIDLEGVYIMSRLKYESPVSEINEFETVDVVTTSLGDGNNLIDGDGNDGFPF